MECVFTADLEPGRSYHNLLEAPGKGIDLGSWFVTPPSPKHDLATLVLDQLLMPALLVNVVDEIVGYNAAAARLFGREAETLLGRHWRQLHYTGEMLSQGSGLRGPAQRLSTGNSRSAWRRISLAPTEMEASLVVLLQLESDPTHPGFADEGSLLLDVAHELRSLLLSFNLALGGLIERITPAGDDQRRLVSALQRSGVHVQTLLENLLDAASVGASQLSVTRTDTNLAMVLQEACLVIDPLLGPNAQQISVELPAATLIVDADPQRLRQVLVNLLHNAIKYGPRGETIRLRAQRTGRWVRVEVSDRGPGIPADEQPHLFERYYRGRGASHAEPGTGLGLAIAKAIVQAHGGEIGVRSMPGADTTFWFTIPHA